MSTDEIREHALETLHEWFGKYVTHADGTESRVTVVAVSETTVTIRLDRTDTHEHATYRITVTATEVAR